MHSSLILSSDLTIFMKPNMTPESLVPKAFLKRLNFQVFRAKVIRLLDLGYALRVRLPLFISCAFVLCHFIRCVCA